MSLCSTKIAGRKCDTYRYGIVVHLLYSHGITLAVLVLEYRVIDANVRSSQIVSKKHAETRALT